MIYVDTNVIIRFVEGDAASREPVRARLKAEPAWATSQLSRIECRCRPMRDQDQALLEAYNKLFVSAELRMIEIDAVVIDIATELRAAGFRTPDAIHLACAVACGADVFLTGDRQLTRCQQVPVDLI